MTSFQEVKVPNASYSKLVDEHGSVGVVLTNNYGMGWSSSEWKSDHKPRMMFDSRLVLYVLSGDNTRSRKDAYEDLMKTIFPERDPDSYMPGCHGAFTQLKVEFVPKNTVFTVAENDGAEFIVTDIFTA
jgi:hypothetical protein